MDALKEVNNVKTIFLYKNCQLIRYNQIEDKCVDAIGRMKIEIWECFKKESIRNDELFAVFLCF